jgi:phenylpyruvate tautomerase PptA (4-oxalocrotonate tautomerase family)
LIDAIIYVEGRSDKLAMEALFKPLIERKLEEQVSIRFYEGPPGSKKATLVTKVPTMAVDILRNNPNAIVIAMPDLYPKNIGFPHETFAQLRDGMVAILTDTLQKKRLDTRLQERFKVFCFKYELEALILAAEAILANWLEVDISSFEGTWIKPVEDQNHQHPPKEIIEALFRANGQFYRETLDARLILEKADYRQIAEACPQCFKPFVEFLEGL